MICEVYIYYGGNNYSRNPNQICPVKMLEYEVYSFFVYVTGSWFTSPSVIVWTIRLTPPPPSPALRTKFQADFLESGEDVNVEQRYI